ncbi:MAG TPA: uroporphyrinogen decarboxylase family protein [Thermoguttaceae bacterium]|nr:uroporphyrinogen decarboxylase family protein [Thermoguttaceae bacterium]
MLSAKQRVLHACEFRPPDRLPRFDSFWEFPDSWRQRLGDPEDLTDVSIWYPDETPFPSRARRLKEADGYVYEIDGWGRTVRRRPGAFFVETLEAPIADGARLDSIRFDPPALDSRYLTGRMAPPVTYGSDAEMHEGLAEDKRRLCVFGKTGGPYLRSTYVRGETALLTDCAADPSFARAVADKMGEHLTAVGLEQLRRWDLYDTGIWIYDDMAYNRGPMFSPKQFEIVFLPAYRRMIRAYKEAGAKYVFLHSDGDVRTILDVLVDAGIDGLNPLERRANMQMTALRKQYPKLILTGGMCNTRTLLRGTRREIEAEAREIIDLGRDGGIVIGTHSVSPEIPLENFVAYHEACTKYGRFGE